MSKPDAYIVHFLSYNCDYETTVVETCTTTTAYVLPIDLFNKVNCVFYRGKRTELFAC